MRSDGSEDGQVARIGHIGCPAHEVYTGTSAAVDGDEADTNLGGVWSHVHDRHQLKGFDAFAELVNALDLGAVAGQLCGELNGVVDKLRSEGAESVRGGFCGDARIAELG